MAWPAWRRWEGFGDMEISQEMRDKLGLQVARLERFRKDTEFTVQAAFYEIKGLLDALNILGVEWSYEFGDDMEVSAFLIGEERFEI